MYLDKIFLYIFNMNVTAWKTNCLSVSAQGQANIVKKTNINKNVMLLSKLNLYPNLLSEGRIQKTEFYFQ